MTKKPSTKTKKKSPRAEAVVEEILQKDEKALRVRSRLTAGKEHECRVCEHKNPLT
jgi:hypothetical protein